MGYPMTFKRVMNRNGLKDGDYGRAPERHRPLTITDPTAATSMSVEETKLGRYDALAECVDRYEKAFMLLAGDLRRLERDAVDESAACRHIARRTGVDGDVVAAVLKEFIEW